MNRNLKWAAGALALALVTVSGCRNADAAAPPTPGQEQQRADALLNDPHVPDAVKQHLMDQRNAAHAAAAGYTAALKAKTVVK